MGFSVAPYRRGEPFAFVPRCNPERIVTRDGLDTAARRVLLCQNVDRHLGAPPPQQIASRQQAMLTRV
jgi:hypothetical protein